MEKTNYCIANKIEQQLQKKYDCLINVSNKAGNLLEVRVFIKRGKEMEFLYLWLEHFTIEYNIENLEKTIDKQIVKLFKKER